MSLAEFVGELYLPEVYADRQPGPVRYGIAELPYRLSTLPVNPAAQGGFGPRYLTERYEALHIGRITKALWSPLADGTPRYLISGHVALDALGVRTTGPWARHLQHPNEEVQAAFAGDGIPIGPLLDDMAWAGDEHWVSHVVGIVFGAGAPGDPRSFVKYDREEDDRE